MPAVLSKEAELKDQLAHVKGLFSDADKKAGNLSKDLASAQDKVKSHEALVESNKELKKLHANALAKVQQLEADVKSFQAQAAKADSVLAAAKALKSLLASV